MRYEKGEKVQFTAQRDCVLCGVRFRKGDQVEVTLKRDWDETQTAGCGGPWGWGGYTSRTIKSLAQVICDLRNGEIIFERKEK